MEERTERESDRRKDKKWQTYWCCRDQQRTCRLQQKKLSILGLLKRKEWPQCHRESSWQVRWSRPCQKENKQSRQSKVPDHERGESQGELEPLLDEREGEHEEERVDSTVKEGKFQRGKGGQAIRASLGEVEGSVSG